MYTGVACCLSDGVIFAVVVVHPRDVIPSPSVGDFLAQWSRMTLRVIQQTHYYEEQTRRFLQQQWSRMTLKIIRSWETMIACTGSNIRHTIKWPRNLAERRFPRPEGTIVRNRDPDDDADAAALQ